MRFRRVAATGRRALGLLRHLTQVAVAPRRAGQVLPEAQDLRDVLGLRDRTGDLGVGRRFDAVWLRPSAGTTLDVALRYAAGPEDALAKAFVLGSPADIDTVWVDGRPCRTRHLVA